LALAALALVVFGAYDSYPLLPRDPYVKDWRGELGSHCEL